MNTAEYIRFKKALLHSYQQQMECYKEKAMTYADLYCKAKKLCNDLIEQIKKLEDNQTPLKP